jgi:molybdopterin molybdotransferase
VSSLVCFELFVRPALARLAGRSGDGLRRVTARLNCDFMHRGDRVTMFPAALQHDDRGWLATPLNYRGSGDLRALSEAQGLIHFPATERLFATGDDVSVLLF